MRRIHWDKNVELMTETMMRTAWQGSEYQMKDQFEGKSSGTKSVVEEET